MRLSSLFQQTLREGHGEGDSPGLKLLQRAGFLRASAPGVYAFLPLGRRTIQRIEEALDRQMGLLGAHRLDVPMFCPLEQWQELSQGRRSDPPLRFRDRGGRDMVLVADLEPLVTDLVRRQVRSYKQLPSALYQIQNGYLDQPSAAGLIRARESVRMSLLSYHASADDLDGFYGRLTQSYLELFRRCGLDVVVADSEIDVAGSATATSFVFPTKLGEQTLLVCPRADYSAIQEYAAFLKRPAAEEAPQPLEELLTPECKTMDALAQFLGVPKEKTAKTLFLVADGQFLCVVLRGDMSLSEAKLAKLVGARTVGPATEGEMLATGAVPGYGSPVGLEGIKIVVDELITRSPNLVAGANREGYHLRNVNYERDFQATLVGDVAAARAGDRCPRCGTPLEAVQGTQVGGARRIGVELSELSKACYLDGAGKSQPMMMGSYSLDLLRLLVCAAEGHHDDKGLIWPSSVAPYQLYFMSIGGDRPEVGDVADRIYQDLGEVGIETLYDDRKESPGAKFGDADLIGLPLRLTVSQRGLKQGEVEIKLRKDGQLLQVRVEDAVGEIQRQLRGL